MSIKKVQTASFALLLVTLILSLYVSGASTQDTTLVRNFPQTKLIEENHLFIIEPVNPTPNRLNFSYTANTTISLFVQTRSQYEGSSKDSVPEDYMATFTGEEGVLTYEPTDQSKRHVISVFAEEMYLVEDIVFEAEYISMSESDLPITFNILQLLIFVGLLTQGYSLSLQNKVV